MNYFGTDGIRGIAHKFPDCRLAYACGNALCALKNQPKVVLCRDTRPSGTPLSHAFAAGVTTGGGNVSDYGVLPTPAVSLLIQRERADFGAVISASHNPAEYNGIKIFTETGEKAEDPLLEKLESAFFTTVHGDTDGSYTACDGKEYLAFLQAHAGDLSDLRVVLDCANGATVDVAPAVFERAGATVSVIGRGSGKFINDGCGALHPQKMSRLVVATKSDLGFSFDGDGDRVIACDASGNILDGDDILYVLARHFLPKGGTVVGTVQTNGGVVQSLAARNVELLRADVGDRYVLAMLKRTGATLGGESSGHILLPSILPSGDGVLAALLLSSLLRTENTLCEIEKYAQETRNVPVRDKVRVLGDEKLSLFLEEERRKLSGGRIIVRASGTEPVIRILAEGKNRRETEECADRLEAYIFALCEKDE